MISNFFLAIDNERGADIINEIAASR